MLTVFTQNTALTNTYSLKWKIEDTSSASSSNFVEETFDLIVISCVNNVLTKTGTGLGTQTYYVGDTSLQLLPNYGISTTVDLSRCPLTYSYFLKNTSGSWILQTSNTAPFTAFVTSTGELTIFTSNRALATIYSIKWKIYDPSSTSSSNYIEEIFDLHVVTVCANN